MCGTNTYENIFLNIIVPGIILYLILFISNEFNSTSIRLIAATGFIPISFLLFRKKLIDWKNLTKLSLKDWAFFSVISVGQVFITLLVIKALFGDEFRLGGATSVFIAILVLQISSLTFYNKKFELNGTC